MKATSCVFMQRCLEITINPARTLCNMQFCTISYLNWDRSLSLPLSQSPCASTGRLREYKLS